MRARSPVLFHSQRPFSICGIPYRVLLSTVLVFVVVICVLLAFMPVLVLVAFPVLSLGLIPIFFACRKDHHADRIFYCRPWWKRQRLRRFAAGGPYYA